MSEAKELKAGDPCPRCGGELRVDASQHPDRVIALDRERQLSPDVHGAYARRTREKAAAAGVIHKCGDCGYEARFAEAKSKGK